MDGLHSLHNSTSVLSCRLQLATCMLSIVLPEEDVWDPEIWMKHLAQSGNRPPVLVMLFERVKDSWDELSLQPSSFRCCRCRFDFGFGFGSGSWSCCCCCCRRRRFPDCIPASGVAFLRQWLQFNEVSVGLPGGRSNFVLALTRPHPVEHHPYVSVESDVVSSKAWRLPSFLVSVRILVLLHWVQHPDQPDLCYIFRAFARGQLKIRGSVVLVVERAPNGNKRKGLAKWCRAMVPFHQHSVWNNLLCLAVSRHQAYPSFKVLIGLIRTCLQHILDDYIAGPRVRNSPQISDQHLLLGGCQCFSFQMWPSCSKLLQILALGLNTDRLQTPWSYRQDETWIPRKNWKLLSLWAERLCNAEARGVLAPKSDTHGSSIAVSSLL